MRRSLRRLLPFAFAAALVTPAVAADAAKVPLSPPYVYPPWQNGQNNDVAERGVEFTVPEVENLPDFHGNPVDAKLVLYVGGNYFFALAPLVLPRELAIVAARVHVASLVSAAPLSTHQSDGS